MFHSLERFLLTTIAAALAAQPAGAKVNFDAFDLQGHRGARDARPENTIAAFAFALEVGVSTLELDLAITRDGHVVVSHNPYLEPYLTKDRDGRWLAEQARPLIYGLTLAELQEYDVGAVNPLSPYWLLHGRMQEAAPGERVPTLSAVFELARRYGANGVRFNVETKIDPRHPDRAPDPYTFARRVLDDVERHGMRDRVMIQSFDWRTLFEVRRLDKDITRVALTAEVVSWGPGGLYREVGRPGCSPWMGGLDIDDFDGDFVRAAKAAHADVLSPAYVEVTREVVTEAHELGMRVVPWTVNERADMARLMDLGVDGLITDRPADLREILIARGIPVPPAARRP